MRPTVTVAPNLDSFQAAVNVTDWHMTPMPRAIDRSPAHER